MFGYKTKQQLLDEGYTHYGSLWGIPCCIGDIDSDAPMVETANFIPQWVLDVADWLVFNLYYLVNANNPHCEDLPFKICLKRRIEL